MALLFSYGSNHPVQMAERLGRDVETMGAFLPGYVRVFRGWSQRWGGGVASLKKEKGGVVFGLVTEADAADLAKMDRFEGVGSGNYKRQTVPVVLATGERVKAVAYVSTSAEFNMPSREYLEAVARTVGTHWRGDHDTKITWQDITVR
jgi:cation transport regulator ChaC